MTQSQVKVKEIRPIVYGEVLFDHFPDGAVILGGAPFNVAWHLQAFGLAPLFISRVGNDALGRKISNAMKSWGMDCSGLQLDCKHPTGTVNVSFTDGEPDFDIIGETAYDYIDAEAFPAFPKNCLIYHGSLALRGQTSRQSLQKLKQLTLAPSFVDINLRSPWWTQSIVDQLILGARWLKLNEQELDQIFPGDRDKEEKLDCLLQKLSLQCLVVTRGARGATAAINTEQKYHACPSEAQTVVDTVGAGDAFSSVMLIGLLKAWPVPESLRRAQDFASAIVGVRGATVSDTSFYEPFVTSWGLD